MTAGSSRRTIPIGRHSCSRRRPVPGRRSGTWTSQGTSPFTSDVIVARTGAMPVQPFRERALAGALARLRSELRDKRYYAAVASYTPPPEEGTEIDLVLRVDAGPRSSFTVEPAYTCPAAKPTTYIPIKREGSIDRRSARRRERRHPGRAEAGRLLEGRGPAQPRRARARPAPDHLQDHARMRYRIERVELPAELRSEPRARGQGNRARRRRVVPREPGAGRAPSRLVASQYVRAGLLRARSRAGSSTNAPVDPARRRRRRHPPEHHGGAARHDRRHPVRSRRHPDRHGIRRPVRHDAHQGRAVRQGQHRARCRGAQRVLRDPGVSARVAQTSSSTRPERRRPSRSSSREGPQLLVGEITVVGNAAHFARDDPAGHHAAPRQPYSEDKRLESQRLLGTPAFRSTRIVPEPRLPGENTRPHHDLGRGAARQRHRRRRRGRGRNARAGGRGRRRRGRARVLARARSSRSAGGTSAAATAILNFFSRVALRSRTVRGDPEGERRHQLQRIPRVGRRTASAMRFARTPTCSSGSPPNRPCARRSASCAGCQRRRAPRRHAARQRLRPLRAGVQRASSISCQTNRGRSSSTASSRSCGSPRCRAASCGTVATMPSRRRSGFQVGAAGDLALDAHRLGSWDS